ncbi:hypothetical protein GW17_00027963 [Ensete ventricosum]|nr:hypothetical protein GW17_00027963 [Ensete ventricosum]
MVESIYLSVHSGNFDAFPVSVSLPPNTSKVILLSGIPTKVGAVSIPGCIVHCFGVITEHLFRDVDNLLLGASQGLVLSDPFRCCGSTKPKNVSTPNISVVSPLPLLVSHVVGGNGSTILYEGEIRDIWTSLTNAGTVPIEQAHIALSGKNQDSVISIAHDVLLSSLPLKPGGEVTIPVTVKAWQLSLTDSEFDASKSSSGSPWTSPDESNGSGNSVPPGRRLVVPLNVCVLRGLRFVRARLLSMEFPARVSEALPKQIYGENGITEELKSVNQNDSLVKIDPHRGSWGLRLLELELSNPTDVVFEVNVSMQLDSQQSEHGTANFSNEDTDFGYRKTRIDRDYSARVLIPMEHFKLPVLDASFFSKDAQINNLLGNKVSSTAERNAKAELNASINNLISKIKVKWHSGRNSSGELNIKDATQAALQASIMDILLPDPLTFGFRFGENGTASENTVSPEESSISDNPPGQPGSRNVGRAKGSVLAHEMTHMEVIIRNNTKERIKMSLNVSCRDVAGENCIEGNKATVLWAAAVINDTTDVLRARAKSDSSDEPIFCRGSPFHVHVVGTA